MARMTMENQVSAKICWFVINKCWLSLLVLVDCGWWWWWWSLPDILLFEQKQPNNIWNGREEATINKQMTLVRNPRILRIPFPGRKSDWMGVKVKDIYKCRPCWFVGKAEQISDSDPSFFFSLLPCFAIVPCCYAEYVDMDLTRTPDMKSFTLNEKFNLCPEIELFILTLHCYGRKTTVPIINNQRFCRNLAAYAESTKTCMHTLL